MEIQLKDLEEFEANITEMGYIKYNQDYRHSDFQFWKCFYENDEKIYQIGMTCYDWSKYEFGDDHIGVDYECMFLDSDRIDLIVSKNIKIEEFEIMALDFYNTMKKYI